MECGCKGIRSCFICEKQDKTTQKSHSHNVHVYTYCYKCQKAWLDNTKHNGMGNQHSEKCHKSQTDEDINEDSEQSLECSRLFDFSHEERTCTITTDADGHPICYEGLQRAGQNTNKTEVELGCSDHDGQAVDFPGIHLCCNFVSNIEEKAICDKIYETPFVLSQSGRRKQDYGPKVNFKRKKLKVADFTGLPEYSKDIYERMRKMDILSDFKPVELCNLEYSSERGSSIEPHFDDFWLWGERLVTLNLLSDSVLCFTNENQPGIEVHVPMFRRSLLIVYGPARHLWKHAIHRSDILSKRLAITFRELSDEFKDGGPRGDEGNQLLDIALTFTGQAIGSNTKPLEKSEP